VNSLSFYERDTVHITEICSVSIWFYYGTILTGIRERANAEGIGGVCGRSASDRDGLGYTSETEAR
jgi:hypothetical protein